LDTSNGQLLAIKNI
jgi:mitogen-activated protein kinase kinase kinase ANP1